MKGAWRFERTELNDIISVTGKWRYFPIKDYKLDGFKEEYNESTNVGSKEKHVIDDSIKKSLWEQLFDEWSKGSFEDGGKLTDGILRERTLHRIKQLVPEFLCELMKFGEIDRAASTFEKGFENIKFWEEAIFWDVVVDPVICECDTDVDGSSIVSFPDDLISVTTVTESIDCTRKMILGQIVEKAEYSSIPLFGSMIHSLFEKIIKYYTFGGHTLPDALIAASQSYYQKKASKIPILEEPFAALPQFPSSAFSSNASMAFHIVQHCSDPVVNQLFECFGQFIECVILDFRLQMIVYGVRESEARMKLYSFLPSICSFLSKSVTKQESLSKAEDELACKKGQGKYQMKNVTKENAFNWKKCTSLAQTVPSKTSKDFNSETSIKLKIDGIVACEESFLCAVFGLKGKIDANVWMKCNVQPNSYESKFFGVHEEKKDNCFAVEICPLELKTGNAGVKKKYQGSTEIGKTVEAKMQHSSQCLIYQGILRHEYNHLRTSIQSANEFPKGESSIAQSSYVRYFGEDKTFAFSEEKEKKTDANEAISFGSGILLYLKEAKPPKATSFSTSSEMSLMSYVPRTKTKASSSHSLQDEGHYSFLIPFSSRQFSQLLMRRNEIARALHATLSATTEKSIFNQKTELDRKPMKNESKLQSLPNEVNKTVYSKDLKIESFASDNFENEFNDSKFETFDDFDFEKGIIDEEDENLEFMFKKNEQEMKNKFEEERKEKLFAQLQNLLRMKKANEDGVVSSMPLSLSRSSSLLGFGIKSPSSFLQLNSLRSTPLSPPVSSPFSPSFVPSIRSNSIASPFSPVFGQTTISKQKSSAFNSSGWSDSPLSPVTSPHNSIAGYSFPSSASSISNENKLWVPSLSKRGSTVVEDPRAECHHNCKYCGMKKICGVVGRMLEEENTANWEIERLFELFEPNEFESSNASFIEPAPAIYHALSDFSQQDDLSKSIPSSSSSSAALAASIVVPQKLPIEEIEIDNQSLKGVFEIDSISNSLNENEEMEVLTDSGPLLRTLFFRFWWNLLIEEETKASLNSSDLWTATSQERELFTGECIGSLIPILCLKYPFTEGTRVQEPLFGKPSLFVSQQIGSSVPSFNVKEASRELSLATMDSRRADEYWEDDRPFLVVLIRLRKKERVVTRTRIRKGDYATISQDKNNTIGLGGEERNKLICQGHDELGAFGGLKIGNGTIVHVAFEEKVRIPKSYSISSNNKIGRETEIKSEGIKEIGKMLHRILSQFSERKEEIKETAMSEGIGSSLLAQSVLNQYSQLGSQTQTQTTQGTPSKNRIMFSEKWKNNSSALSKSEGSINEDDIIYLDVVLVETTTLPIPKDLYFVNHFNKQVHRSFVSLNDANGQMDEALSFSSLIPYYNYLPDSFELCDILSNIYSSPNATHPFYLSVSILPLASKSLYAHLRGNIVELFEKEEMEEEDCVLFENGVKIAHDKEAHKQGPQTVDINSKTIVESAESKKLEATCEEQNIEKDGYQEEKMKEFEADRRKMMDEWKKFLQKQRSRLNKILFDHASLNIGGNWLWIEERTKKNRDYSVEFETESTKDENLKVTRTDVEKDAFDLPKTKNEFASSKSEDDSNNLASVVQKEDKDLFSWVETIEKENDVLVGDLDDLEWGFGGSEDDAKEKENIFEELQKESEREEAEERRRMAIEKELEEFDFLEDNEFAEEWNIPRNDDSKNEIIELNQKEQKEKQVETMIKLLSDEEKKRNIIQICEDSSQHFPTINSISVDNTPSKYTSNASRFKNLRIPPFYPSTSLQTLNEAQLYALSCCVLPYLHPSSINTSFQSLSSFSKSTSSTSFDSESLISQGHLSPSLSIIPIVGVPGAGKTHLIAQMIHIMLWLHRSSPSQISSSEQNTDNNEFVASSLHMNPTTTNSTFHKKSFLEHPFRILVCAHTHSAVDNILLQLQKKRIPFLRIGRSENVDDNILKEASNFSANFSDGSQELKSQESVFASPLSISSQFVSTQFSLASNASTISQIEVDKGTVSNEKKSISLGKEDLASKGTFLEKTSNKNNREGQTLHFYPGWLNEELDDDEAHLQQLIEWIPVIGITALSFSSTFASSLPLPFWMNFDLCIVDEASQLLLPGVIPPILRSVRTVLVGDPHQLTPLIHSIPFNQSSSPQSLHRSLSSSFSEKRSSSLNSPSSEDATSPRDFRLDKKMEYPSCSELTRKIQRSPLINGTKLEFASSTIFQLSLLSYLCLSHPENVVILSWQYRMNKAIETVANRVVYGGLLEEGSPTSMNQQTLQPVDDLFVSKESNAEKELLLQSPSKYAIQKVGIVEFMPKCNSHPILSSLASIGCDWLLPILNPLHSVIFISTDKILKTLKEKDQMAGESDTKEEIEEAELNSLMPGCGTIIKDGISGTRRGWSSIEGLVIGIAVNAIVHYSCCDIQTEKEKKRDAKRIFKRIKSTRAKMEEAVKKMNEKMKVTRGKARSEKADKEMIERLLANRAIEMKHQAPVNEIGVIAPYRAQVKLIQNVFQLPVSFSSHSHHSHSKHSPVTENRHRNVSKFKRGPNVQTIDSFQGKEQSVIMLSLTNSGERNVSEDCSLLSDWRRLTVALTRAKRKLIIVGSYEELQRESEKGKDGEENCLSRLANIFEREEHEGCYSKEDAQPRKDPENGCSNASYLPFFPPTLLNVTYQELSRAIPFLTSCASLKN
eukprot:MONOS_1633.1-p1 / transcript=MONOS_1633.1 / gene=MONOS_1633 / organism=Monocercomonoides_exilis_PA203 / gene_product=DNA replication ATP-dependent helicase/nuclease DNA2 / transcript_product=DNA replication ATP-dependent helicase/nuclease DNA2 / location=Mono_scaffold00030:5921-13999(-) / protein_length=2671 / sequence_SO=supercontig / SO=protein_coding / is_pseudo=false